MLKAGEIALVRIPGRKAFRPVVIIHIPPPRSCGGPSRTDREHGRVLARFPVSWMVPAGVRGSSGADGRTEAQWMPAEGLVKVETGTSCCAHRKEAEI